MNLLIVRLSAIGDIVMSAPFASSLRERYPDACIHWLVEPSLEALVASHRHVDGAIVWPKDRWRQLWGEGRLATLLGEMRAFAGRLKGRYDRVFDLQGLMKSGILAWMSRAPERIGLRSREGSGRLMTRTVEPPRGDRRFGSEYRYLAETLGLPPYRLAWPFEVPGPKGLPRDVAVLCPFTTRPQKHWVEGRWQDLAARLAALGLAPVVLGGGRRAPFPAPAIDLAGRTTLPEAAAIIRRARLVVGVDTGLTHMGVAAGVPTVALFGATCPYLEVESPRVAILYKGLPCSPCRRHPTCGGAYPCLAGIGVGEVMEAVHRVLA